MEVFIGLLPVFLVASTALLLIFPLVFKSRENRIYVEYMAVTCSSIAIVMSLIVLLHVNMNDVTTYFLGGFNPPLGIAYTVDKLSALFAFLSTLMLLFTVLYSSWFMVSKWNYLYYSLLFLMTAGSIGCFFTGDIFNLFVSLELLAISSYGLVAFYRDNPRAIRASLRYAIVGTVATSLYFFSTLLIYSAFGTLNMADIALKARNPLAQTPFSHTVAGDIVFTSKIALSIMIWVFFFKSAILPIGFTWQPYAYAEAPVPVAAGFTAIADIVGVYLFMRFTSTIFGQGVIEELVGFRSVILSFTQIIAVISALIASLLMVVESNIKKFIAYSTIAQLSLALFGASLDNHYGIAAAILLVMSNTLGDAMLFYIAGIALIGYGRSIKCLSTLKAIRAYKYILISLIIAILNLFGVIPVLIGFWGKALLILAGIEKSIVIPALVLIISGITAIGYFRLLQNTLASSTVIKSNVRLKNTTIPVLLVFTLAVISVVLGVCFIICTQFRKFILDIGLELINDYEKYMESALVVSEL
uniref:NADH:quinone oxidoreductase/Mrp antiporter transmembrane domain-containing protein n=1 Tax=Ignisphaera aggregans TaxID=334771 RepID=A0A7C5XQ47_9CREN